MRHIETQDRLQEEFAKNLPKIDSDQAWSQLQTRLAGETTLRGRTRLRPRRGAILPVAVVGVAVVAIALVTVSALGLFTGANQVASVDGPTSTQSTLTSMIAPTTAVTSLPATTATSNVSVQTTSPDWAARSRAAMRLGTQVGDAVISYLDGERDLASVEVLVAPSAQEGLAEMLSLLSEPTACTVTRTAGSDTSDVVEVELQFSDGSNETLGFSLTVLVGPNEVEITQIQSGAGLGP